jgi:hypothetical protein
MGPINQKHTVCLVLLCTSGSLLITPAPVLQPVRLLVDAANQSVCCHISGWVSRAGGSQELRHEGCQFVWDVMQDRALVVLVRDLDPSYSLLARGREEVPDVPLGDIASRGTRSLNLWLWLGLRRVWLSQDQGQAKVVDQGLALAWPRPRLRK